MPPMSAWRQLYELCSDGATPSSIEVTAPFLRSLPATRHACEVLKLEHESNWPIAARELLICVTNPGGAAKYDERTSWFVQMCFDMQSTALSFSQRLQRISENEEYSFDADSRTHKRKLATRLNSLAATLIALQRFPCAPLTHWEKRLKVAAGIVTATMAQVLEVDPSDEEGWATAMSELWDQLRGARAQFDRYLPNATEVELLRVMVGAVVSDRYVRGLYDEVRSNVPVIVDVSEVLSLLNGGQMTYLPLEEELQLGCESVADVLLEVEAQGAWGDVVIRLARGQDSVASIDGSDDDPDDDLDLPRWLK